MNSHIALLSEVISCDTLSPVNVCLEQGSAHALDNFMEQDSIKCFRFCVPCHTYSTVPSSTKRPTDNVSEWVWLCSNNCTDTI